MEARMTDGERVDDHVRTYARIRRGSRVRAGIVSLTPVIAPELLVLRLVSAW